MSRRPRRNHTAAFKAKVALTALKGEKTLLELAQQFDVHANQITQWKSQLLEGAAGVFGGDAKAEPAEAAVDVKTLHAKIGQLTLENDFLGRGAHEGRASERKKMIDREHKLSIKRQAKILGIGRGTAYYTPRPVSEKDLLLMRKLDELHLNYPFGGSRMLRDLLRQQGHDVGRLHIGTLMKKMGIEAIYRRPNTSKPAPGQRIYPYLLREVAVTRPNQAWAMDISYIPMARGFVYLAAVVDWFSRKILSWKLSVTMDVSFCLEAVEEALSKHDKPEIFNTDQGSQFTSEAFTEHLRKNEIQISMDGKGCWRDNVFVERIWRTIKYEEVYLRAYGSVQEARTSLGKYIVFYNQTRPHSSLKGKTPNQVHLNRLPETMAA
ncbi:IS3 family transposase [Granulicella sibirica]